MLIGNWNVMRSMKMSKFNGALLFDVADEPIGNWRENLGGRGLYNRWDLYDENEKIIETLYIESYDSELNEDDNYELWVHTADGMTDTINFFSDYDDAIKWAKEEMSKNLNGFYDH